MDNSLTDGKGVRQGAGREVDRTGEPPLEQAFQSELPSAPPQCTCIQDPFADLPPELRPRAKTYGDGIREVTCPRCGLTFLTNRATSLCWECARKGEPPARPSERPHP